MSTEILTDGMLAVPVQPRGLWAALRALRTEMAARGGVRVPREVFLVAYDQEGRTVAPLDPRAALLLLGYRLD